MDPQVVQETYENEDLTQNIDDISKEADLSTRSIQKLKQTTNMVEDIREDMRLVKAQLMHTFRKVEKRGKEEIVIGCKPSLPLVVSNTKFAKSDCADESGTPKDLRRDLVKFSILVNGQS
ncbi:hypothetical protein RND71_042420 [Anisodus tanguticus]|uniref:Uncharacterized protein n=1 Tax=Anisodus tanguticus TaxID=243964 RepID=A0AAE1QQV0_9SOLA|nr:hypothetical protein RND71_042420 [Anisodus tanguticus]